ncbi:MAG: hypothetical protein KC731_30835 [Myxococcales bacterium]|nr:hypothetical protein [Myxococcales bacterium]
MSARVPDFRIDIEGALVPAELRASVTSVNHSTSLEGADRVEVSLVNEGLRWLDHPLLALDNDLELWMGYAGELKRVFVGEIVSREANFPSGGQPVLTFCAQDRRHRLAGAAKNRVFPIPIPGVGNYPIPDIGVATFVSAENALLPAFDPVGAAISVIVGGIEAAGAAGDVQAAQKMVRAQIEESDYDFLTRISRENGWDMVVEHAGPLGGYVLRFFSSLDQLTEYARFRYGESLIEFTPRISKVGSIINVSAHVFISAIKLMLRITVGWDFDRMALTLMVVPSIAPVPEQGGSSPKSFEYFGPQTPYSSARKILGHLLPKLNNRLTASGSVVGDPTLSAGKVIAIEGVGREFGGLYRIKSAEHSLDSSGYTTRFDLRKEVWFGSIPLPEQGALPLPPPIRADLPLIPH